MNWQLFSAFLLITAVLVLTPGPIVTLVISTAATRGIRAALITVSGTVAGNALLVAAIAAGLNVIINYAAVLFEVMRWAGAAYLVWLGIQAWRNAGAVQPIESARHVHFVRGFIVAISNPKTIAFFTAFLPQFVDPTLPVGWQLFVMCSVAVTLASLTDVGYALIAGAGRKFFLRPGSTKWLGRLSGLALVGGGIWLSLARRPT
ncbi:MAG: LysE family translocator [Xanthobacteraceae bacterium]|uniref:LysE family translocator n=1 Tax=Pseudolabrys sp. TaxID=1960880 RepID=UPI003D0A54B4